MHSLYVDDIVVQWDKYVQCGRHICSGAYASNVKCMYTSAPGHTADTYTLPYGATYMQAFMQTHA